jgi:hypothetical protein
MIRETRRGGFGGVAAVVTHRNIRDFGCHNDPAVQIELDVELVGKPST